MVSVEEFGEYIGEPCMTWEREAMAQRCVISADQAIAAAYNVSRMPVAVHELAVLHVASELWTRRSNPGGIIPSAFEGGISARLGRDALASVRSMLAPYVRLVVG